MCSIYAILRHACKQITACIIIIKDYFPVLLLIYVLLWLLLSFFHNTLSQLSVYKTKHDPVRLLDMTV